MEKNLKVVRTIAVLLLIVLLSVIAFCGINEKFLGVWLNVVEDYKYGMEFDGYRELRFVLDSTTEETEVYVDKDGNVVGKPEDGTNTVGTSGITLETDATKKEENKQTDDAANAARVATGYAVETRTLKENEDSVVTKENFDLTKKIIQERLETIPGYEYNIRMDDITGEMLVEVPDNDNIELEKSLILTKGRIDVIDHQTGVVLLNNSDFAEVSQVTSELEDGSGVQIFMSIQANEEGTKKIAELSKAYRETVDGQGNATSKYVTVRLDGQTLVTTYFSEDIPNGQLNIPMGEPATDEATYNEMVEQLDRLINIINGKQLPLVYALTADNFIESEITDEVIMTAKVVFWTAVVIASAYMIAKYKLKGLKLAIISVGYIAIFSLILRYAQITITLDSLVAFVLLVVINYIFSLKILNGFNDNTLTKVVYRNVSKDIYIALVPVMILAVIFSCMSGAIITSIGMVLFWGLFIQALYNALVIRALDVI